MRKAFRQIGHTSSRWRFQESARRAIASRTSTSQRPGNGLPALPETGEKFFASGNKGERRLVDTPSASSTASNQRNLYLTGSPPSRQLRRCRHSRIRDGLSHENNYTPFFRGWHPTHRVFCSRISNYWRPIRNPRPERRPETHKCSNGWGDLRVENQAAAGQRAFGFREFAGLDGSHLQTALPQAFVRSR
jgi:hypothetical protein